LWPLASSPKCCQHLTLKAFADPSSAALVSAQTRSAAALKRLPGSRREVRAIVQRWQPGTSQQWLGPDFTRSEALQALSDANAVVHFATHGLVDRQTPGLNALLVAADDQRLGLDVLGSGDIRASAINAPLVVLGACDAGSGAVIPSIGAVGLAQALIEAGAANVVAPQWVVDDQASISLMQAFYAALNAGEPIARALANAQQAVAREPATRHPFYWAGMESLRRAP
jgi:CHAT domain-containing protein